MKNSNGSLSQKGNGPKQQRGRKVLALQQINKALDQLQNRINLGRKKESTEGYLRALVIGNVAGSRSMLPFALLAWEKDPRKPDTLLPSRLLDTGTARTITTIASIGEMIADKLPSIPSRLGTPSFVGRLISGGLAGMIIAYRFRESPVLGALLGGSGAAFGSVAGYYSRQLLTERTGIPSAIWGVSEDAIATGLGLLATTTASSH
jgi:uncharacterized membrane protein